jgi:hypothetical protein
MEIKDSGKRQEFNTGSVRDTDEGKGSPSLIPGEALLEYKESRKSTATLTTLDYVENNLLKYATIDRDREINIENLYTAIDYTIEYIKSITDGKTGSAKKALAIHYQAGAKKYAANNWRKGQPVSRYYDSAMRHLWAVMDGKTDEPHASALFWNLIAIIQTKIDVSKGLLSKELNNFPFTITETFPTIKEK